MHAYLYMEETGSPSQLLVLLTLLVPTAPSAAERPGKVGEAVGFPESWQGRVGLHPQRHAQAPRLLPGSLPSFPCAGGRLLSFLGTCNVLMHGTSLPGSWAQPVLTDTAEPIPRCARLHPSGFDAKSFLTSPDWLVTFGNSHVWQPTISSQTGELTAASNLCQRSLRSHLGTGCPSPTLQRPCLHNTTTRSTCL